MKKFLNWIKSLFGGALYSFLKEVFTESKSKIMIALKDIATEAVTEMSLTDITNEEKRKFAFDKIKAYAKTVGIKAGDSIINLIIELALSRIKG